MQKRPCVRQYWHNFISEPHGWRGASSPVGNKSISCDMTLMRRRPNVGCWIEEALRSFSIATKVPQREHLAQIQTFPMTDFLKVEELRERPGEAAPPRFLE